MLALAAGMDMGEVHSNLFILARWPALIARVASFLFNSLKIFTLIEEMYFVIYLPLVCSC